MLALGTSSASKIIVHYKKTCIKVDVVSLLSPHGRIQVLRFKIKNWALYETTATKAVAAQHSVAVRARKNKLRLHGYLRQS